MRFPETIDELHDQIMLEIAIRILRQMNSIFEDFSEYRLTNQEIELIKTEEDEDEL